MKVGNLLDKQRGYGLYDYGDDAIVKLFDASVPLGIIKREFNNAALINSMMRESAKVLQIIELDDQYGLVYEKIEGQTLLYQLEADPSKIKDTSMLFGIIHHDVNMLKVDGILSQDDYYEEHINKCEALEENEKKILLEEVKTLPQDKKLCHGNYHPNQVILKNEYRLVGFTNAYLGHPMSDVAKSRIILKVPRLVEGLSEAAQMGIDEKREAFEQLYLKAYDGYDELTCDIFMKFAAITRINEGDPLEIPWLLNLIRNGKGAE